jgi:16S rRNA (cytosine967-C5)-methyltransferase
MYKSFRETHLFAFLNRFDQDTKPLDAALSDYLKAHKSIGAHDRRYIGDAVYSLIRWKGLLDHWLGKPSPWEERFSCMNRLDLSAPHSDLPLAVRCGGSEFLFHELARSHGEQKAAEICRILNEPAPVTVRANLLKTSRENLLALWQQKFDIEECRQSASGIRFKARTALTQLDEFKLGLFEIQDEGSQLIADLIQPSLGDQVLDYCSGSGGKSLAIAPRMAGRGQIYLHDIRPQILIEAKRRMRRAGVQNAQFLPPEHPRLSSLKNKIDWVLADVPCSGSGTYRRNPDMKWKINEAMLDRLVNEQREIFERAVFYVRPGGRIVYATCSLFRRENESQVAYFLQTLPLTLEKEPLSLIPSSDGPDGFFGAVFCKKEI